MNENEREVVVEHAIYKAYSIDRVVKKKDWEPKVSRSIRMNGIVLVNTLAK